MVEASGAVAFLLSGVEHGPNGWNEKGRGFLTERIRDPMSGRGLSPGRSRIRPLASDRRRRITDTDLLATTRRTQAPGLSSVPTSSQRL